MCKVDWFFVGIGLFIILTAVISLFVFVPKLLEADKMCIENGYVKSRVYLSEGSVYCSRKGEFGKDEVVRIK